MTKHLLLGGAAVLLSLIALVTGLGAHAGDELATPGDNTKVSLGAHVISADRALLPLVPAYAGEAATNPFTMKRAELRSSHLNFPPPPPLDLPALPVLPIPER